MNLIVKLRKLAMSYLSNKNAIFNYDVEGQRKFMDRFTEPRDDIERSFYQYQCQMKLSGLPYKAAVNLISPIFNMVYLLRYYCKQPIRIAYNSMPSSAVYFTNGLSDSYLPDELTGNYSNIIKAELTDSCCLYKEDLDFFWQIVKRYPLSPFFQFKILLKLGVYSKQIELNRPQAVIVSAEYSFTSSAMTSYCSLRGIDHINIQHGEKMLYMQDAFFRFDQCYLWNEFYRDILVQLKADPSQFRISIPPMLSNIRKQINEFKQKNILNHYDIKYYFGSETKSEMIEIKKTLELLRKKDMSICVRPHPRYTDINTFVDVFGKDYGIEDTKNITVVQSLSNCSFAVSLRSFVLQQAYFGGVKTAIDDISLPRYYESLKKIDYIMIEKSSKLSEMLKKDD